MFLTVLLFPVVVIVTVAVFAFMLHCITDASFDAVSTHVVTWVISVITVTTGYIYANQN
jgi:hypothetical protein